MTESYPTPWRVLPSGVRRVRDVSPYQQEEQSAETYGKKALVPDNYDLSRFTPEKLERLQEAFLRELGSPELAVPARAYFPEGPFEVPDEASGRGNTLRVREAMIEIAYWPNEEIPPEPEPVPADAPPTKPAADVAELENA